MHSRCREIVSFDAELAELVADMVATMYAAEGVGLAANQIGVSVKVFVFDCPAEDGATQRGVVCNPRLFVPEGRDRRCKTATRAACLSRVLLSTAPRPDFARVEGVDHHRPTRLL
ncbi:MAG: peptide deformylase [Nocardioidaceae bacterium]